MVFLSKLLGLERTRHELILRDGEFLMLSINNWLGIDTVLFHAEGRHISDWFLEGTGVNVIEKRKPIGCSVKISLSEIILCVVRMQVLQIASALDRWFIISLVLSLDGS